MLKLKSGMIFVSLFLVTTLLYAANEVGANKTQSDADSEILDNIPNECISSNGDLGILAQDKEWCAKHNCEKQSQVLKANYKREHLAKFPDEIGAIDLSNEDAEKLRKIIDGPANLRDFPKGKIIDTFPDKFIVLASGKKEDWYFVRGYWERECHTGWTHKGNLRPITRAEIKSKKQL